MEYLLLLPTAIVIGLIVSLIIIRLIFLTARRIANHARQERLRLLRQIVPPLRSENPQAGIEQPRESFSTRLGRWFARRVANNNARARLLVWCMFFLTVLSFVMLGGILLTADSHSAQANDPIPSMDRSVIRSGYLPDANQFFGYATADSSINAAIPAKSYEIPWGWIIFWLFWWFVVLPVGWISALVYGIASMREESWEKIQNYVASIRESISNHFESGSSKGINDGQVGMISWSAPVFSAPAAAVAAVEKPSLWEQIIGFLKRHSAEIVGALFILEEIIEYKKKNTK